MTYSEGQHFATRMNSLFFEASAKTAVGVADAFKEVVRRIVAEPELVAPSSFPQLAAESAAPAPEPEMSEEERAEVERRRKEQEEKELIMDRLVEEERAQEEADERVSALKSRLERAKAARRAKKA